MISKENIDLNVKDEVLLNELDFIVNYTNTMEKHLKENSSIRSYSDELNFCNHLAIGLAYVLGKRVKGYKFRAFESYFSMEFNNFVITEKMKLDNLLATGNPYLYNHAYCIAQNLETGQLTLIDFQREPIWRNMFKDITLREFRLGDYIYNEYHTINQEHDIEECLKMEDYLTGTVGQELFDTILDKTLAM